MKSENGNVIMKKFVFVVFILLVAAFAAPAQKVARQKSPIIDSKMSESEAFDGLDPNCPAEIRERAAAGHGQILFV